MIACPYLLQQATRSNVSTNAILQQVRGVGLSDTGHAERLMRAWSATVEREMEGADPQSEVRSTSPKRPAAPRGNYPSCGSAVVLAGTSTDNSDVETQREPGLGCCCSSGTTFVGNTSHHSISGEERSETARPSPCSECGRDYERHTGDGGGASFLPIHLPC